jgi:coatomer subunit beta'
MCFPDAGRAAAEILLTTPRDQMNKVACFLEGRGLFGNSMTLITNFLDLKELALSLDDLDTALGIVRVVPEHEADVKEVLGRPLGDPCVVGFDLARECFESVGDLNALILLSLFTSGFASEPEK